MDRNAPDELRTHLMESSEEFRRLAAEHADYARQIDALEALPLPSEHERMEEQRLKKLKLRLKDQMELMLSRYRAQQVA
jgi:uncharacterized protein YdcH (DUF465 family)